ncbi:MAG TPA: amidase family protein [Rhizomicrobium sp.]|nr:amidase family protein [Rhizomicrobium sp.]
MKVSEYLRYDAVGLAELVAQRDVSPSELLDAALARLDEVNPTLNAVVRTFEPQARSAIDDGLPPGPFSGVPYLLKDVTTQMAGEITTNGSRLFANARAADDSALVAAYKRAGFVIFGKTNSPEFGLVGLTEPDLWGPTLNPWDLDRTCGGSSGGAASAVAAGIVPAAQASDGGGSIRIPASCCGLFGFKPSRGRVSMAPQGEGWGGLTTLHAVTHSVRDSAAILDASSQPVLGDPYHLAPPQTPFLDEVKRDPGKLRIAMLDYNLNDTQQDPQCTAAVRETAKLCETLGHTVEQAKLPAELKGLLDTAMTIIGATVAFNLQREADRRGRAIAEDEIEPLSRIVWERGKAVTGVQYAQAVQAMHSAGRIAAQWMAPYDVVLLSTMGTLPIPVGLLKNGVADIDQLSAKHANYAPNTHVFNATGQPAMSLPLAMSKEGLPIGIQFAARTGDEAVLFRLAGQLETARPWADRRPSAIPFP